MPIELYELEDLNNIGNAAVKTELPELDPTIPGSFIRAIISAVSILFYTVQRNITAALLDFFPQTASGEPLDFWAGINALTRVPGTVAEGGVTLSGTLAVSIPLGTLFVSSTNEQYISTSAATISTVVGSVVLNGTGVTATAVTPVAHSLVDGLSVTISGASDSGYNVTETINVLDEFTFTYLSTGTGADDAGSYSSVFADIPVSSQDIGTDKNLDQGAVLTLQSTVVGVGSGDQAIANKDGITAGSDLEDDESLRERVLLANSIDPGIFTSAQIRLDALTIPTATRVFVTNPLVAYTTDGTDITDRSVTSITQAAGTATALITDTSNIYVGSTITISGATDTDYNGDWTVLTIVANTSFTFAIDSGTASPAGGTILLNLNKLKNIPQPGVVYVFVLDDNNEPPTPSSTTLTNVEDKIEIKLPAHTPAENVIVVSPIFDTINVSISGLAPDSTSMRSAISANLTAFFQDSADFASDIKYNQMVAAIQNTQDLETGNFVTAFSLDTPSADVSIGNGTMGILGTVTFT